MAPNLKFEIQRCASNIIFIFIANNVDLMFNKEEKRITSTKPAAILKTSRIYNSKQYQKYVWC